MSAAVLLYDSVCFFVSIAKQEISHHSGVAALFYMQETFTDLLVASDPGKRPLTAATPGKPPSTPRQPPSTPRQQTHKYKATELEVSSKTQLDAVLHRSLRKRRTAQTCLNELSSRSHVVVTLTLTQHVPVLQGTGLQHAAANSSSSAGASGSSSPVSRSSSGQLSRQDDVCTTEDGASDCSSEAGAVAPITTYLIG